jgi:DNA-binding NarL/FixJ family response regulator
MKALIADDHAVVRAGLKNILLSVQDINELDEAADGQQVLDLCRKNDYGFIVLDISMPNLNGLDCLATLKEQFPQIPVLMLSIHPEKPFAYRALKMGAAGYLTKDTAMNELITAVNKILSGKKYYSAEFTEQMLQHINDNGDGPLHELLSDREFQIFRFIASGKTPAQIADTLYISSKTIGTYRQRILKKLHLHSTADLIRYAIDNEISD